MGHLRNKDTMGRDSWFVFQGSMLESSESVICDGVNSVGRG